MIVVGSGEVIDVQIFKEGAKLILVRRCNEVINGTLVLAATKFSKKIDGLIESAKLAGQIELKCIPLSMPQKFQGNFGEIWNKVNIFRRRENIWVSVENFDAGDRIFGLRFVGQNQVDEPAWGRPGFMKFLLGWLASYKTVLNEDLQQEFLRSVKAMTLTMPRDSLPAEIFFSAYQDASKFDENLRSNFALVVCNFATKHDFKEISKLIEANCEKGDSDVFMSRYFSEHSWVGVEKQAVESIVKNSLLHRG